MQLWTQLWTLFFLLGSWLYTALEAAFFLLGSVLYAASFLPTRIMAVCSFRCSLFATRINTVGNHGHNFGKRLVSLKVSNVSIFGSHLHFPRVTSIGSFSQAQYLIFVFCIILFLLGSLLSRISHYNVQRAKTLLLPGKLTQQYKDSYKVDNSVVNSTENT